MKSFQISLRITQTELKYLVTPFLTVELLQLGRLGTQVMKRCVNLENCKDSSYELLKIICLIRI